MRPINLIFRALLVSSLTLMLSVTSGYSKNETNGILQVDTTLDSNEAIYQVCSDAPGDCTLRGAISKSNNDPNQLYTIQIPGKQIGLALGGADEDQNATGDLDIRGSVSITGAGAGITSVNGNALDRVFHIHPGAYVEIREITILGGRTTQGDTPSGDAVPGGGIYNAGQLILRNSAVEKNTTGRGGGGIAYSAYGGAGGDGGGI